MYVKRYLMSLMIFLGFVSATVNAAEDARDVGDISRHDLELRDKDMEALRQFIGTKRGEDLKEKATHLAISGDVRTEWRHMNEFKRGVWQRGGSARDDDCIPISRNDFDIEANLYFDYATDRTWASANLQFDNSAGIGDIDCCCDEFECEGVDDHDHCSKEGCCPGPSGTGKIMKRTNRFHGSGQCDDICLKRAYFGATVWSECGAKVDFEIGRRKLYDVFESEIQFLDRFDGLLVKYSDHWESVSDWYIQAAGFLVDERVNHFAYIVEAAFFNIMDSNFDVKYSFIDWRKRGHDRCGNHPREFNFMNSQLIATYHLDKSWTWGIPTEIYGAGLVNHIARKTATEHEKDHGRQAWAWYAGITVGKVVDEGDWSLDVQYQWVQRNAIAYDDQSGIGLGNILGDTCGFVPTVGYKGWQLQFLYAFTDNITLELDLQAARANGDTRHNFSNVQLEAVYAF